MRLSKLIWLSLAVSALLAPSHADAEAPPKNTAIKADLDGDGTAEAATMTASQIRIGGKTAVLPFDRKALPSARIIDVRKRDGHKEILLARPNYEDTDEFVAVAYRKGRIYVSPLFIASRKELAIKGDGKIVNRFSDCGFKYTITFKLTKKGFTRKKKRAGKYVDAICTHPEDFKNGQPID